MAFYSSSVLVEVVGELLDDSRLEACVDDRQAVVVEHSDGVARGVDEVVGPVCWGEADGDMLAVEVGEQVHYDLALSYEAEELECWVAVFYKGSGVDGTLVVEAG